jgi:hypothetical protein
MTLPTNPIPEYSAVRNSIDRYISLNHKQGVNPEKFPVFKEQLIKLQELPSRIYVGSDALRMMINRLNEIGSCIEAFRKLSESTDF